jgi:hypothetical protein
MKTWPGFVLGDTFCIRCGRYKPAIRAIYRCPSAPERRTPAGRGLYCLGAVGNQLIEWAGLFAWDRLSPELVWAEFANVGILTKSD